MAMGEPTIAEFSRMMKISTPNAEDIKRPIGAGCEDNETLLILTGRARYSYNSNDSSPRCEKLAEYIPGTLLQWSLVPRR